MLRKKKLAVKRVDIFGNDRMKTIEVAVCSFVMSGLCEAGAVQAGVIGLTKSLRKQGFVGINAGFDWLDGACRRVVMVARRLGIVLAASPSITSLGNANRDKLAPNKLK